MEQVVNNILYLTDYSNSENQSLNGEKVVSAPSSRRKIEHIIKALKHIGKSEITIITPSRVHLKKFKYNLTTIEKIKKLDIKLINSASLSVPLFGRIFTIITTIINILKENKSRKVSAIIFYNYELSKSIPALFAKILLRIPIIIEYEDGYFANREVNIFYRLILILIEKVCSKFLDGAVVVTSSLKKRMKTENVYICRGIPNYNIISKSQLKTNFAKENEKITIMYSGRFDTIRGIDLFLEALKFIYGDVKVVITGYELLNEWVENEIKKINHIELIKYKFLKEEELSDLLLHADILINPQKINEEFGKYSFPSKVFEFMSTGNIVVSSAVSDVQLIAHNKLVIYYHDSPEELANKVMEVIEDISIYRAYGINCIKWLEDNFSLNSIGMEIQNVIDKATNRRNNK